jgi:hypothetical protein
MSSKVKSAPHDAEQWPAWRLIDGRLCCQRGEGDRWEPVPDHIANRMIGENLDGWSPPYLKS